MRRLRRPSSWRERPSCVPKSSPSRPRLRRRARSWRLAAASLLAVWLAGCALPDYPNQALAPQQANPDFQKLPPSDDPGDPLILIAFSGGGSRAAALSLSVLQQLRGVTYTRNGKTKRLIDRVQVVSSVSGGSVTAAYYGLYGPDKVDGLMGDFLTKDNMAALEWTAANPITWLRLAFTSYTRIDALRDLFDKEMFHGATFADLKGPGHPIVLLNATDMVSGEVFAFTPQRFNDICSDLSKLPVSVGAASSAAFPIALSPMDLMNHSGTDDSGATCAGAIPADPWIEKDLQYEATPYLNLEEFKRARYAGALRRYPNSFRNIHYLHLLDGGVADNQGIHSMRDTLFSPHGPVRLLDEINSGYRKSVVVIVVNARSDPASPLDQDPHTPGIISMIQSVTGVPLDSATASLSAELQSLISDMSAAGAAAPSTAGFAGLKVYGVSIDFDQFRPAQRKLQTQVKDIGTTWTLTSDDLKAIDEAGTLLLHQHPCYQRLLLDLGVKADFINPDFAKSVCPLAGD